MRGVFVLPALVMFASVAQAQQAATSGPGAAQIAMQGAVSGSCPVAVAATDPDDKATYVGVFGPDCSAPEIAAATAALAGFDVAAWPAQQAQQAVTECADLLARTKNELPLENTLKP